MAQRARSQASSRTIQKSRKKNKPPRQAKSMVRRTTPAVQEHPDNRSAHSLTPISNITEQAGMREMMEKMHPNFVGNLAYISMCEAMGISGDFLEAAVPSSIGFLEQMRPVDPLDGLALTQAYVAHARAAWLAKLATTQTNPQSLCLISEASGRASNTFARLMSAIQQYRRPAATTTTVSIGQANLAGQQVVQNVLKQGDQEDGDQTRIGQSGPTAKAAALLPNAERTALSAISRQADAAVDEEHRTPESRRKGAGQSKRVSARPAFSRKHRAPKAGEGDD